MYGTIGPAAARKTITRCPTANSGAPMTTLRKRPSSPPGTRNWSVSPSVPLRYSSTSSVTSVSIVRRSSVHRPSTATTRPRGIARASRASSARSAATTTVAVGRAAPTVGSKRARATYLRIECPPRHLEDGVCRPSTRPGRAKARAHARQTITHPRRSILIRQQRQRFADDGVRCERVLHELGRDLLAGNQVHHSNRLDLHEPPQDLIADWRHAVHDHHRRVVERRLDGGGPRCRHRDIG